MPEKEVKYDWFKNELAGNTADIAEVYQQGFMPENFGIKPVDDYWNKEELRKPFEEKFGPEEGKKKFTELYNTSTKRFTEYQKGRFNINSTNTKRMFPSPYAKKMGELGLAKVVNNPSVQISDVPQDIEGRDIVAGIGSRPEYSFRQGAFDNGVFTGGKLVPYNEFRDTDDRALVYAVDKEGNPLFHEGKTYLRPLNDSEEKGQHEEFATKFSDYMGFNGLDTPDWYVAKFIPKNLSNFTADVLDSGAELLKSVERLGMERGEKPTDFYNTLTGFQNNVNQYMYGSTSDVGNQSWTSTEGLVDGVSQVALQLAAMYGTAGTTGFLLNTAKLAKAAQATRAASVASRMFMSVLASDGIAKEAQAAGLSPRETAGIHALSIFGYSYINKLSEWVIGTNPAMQKFAMDSLLKRHFSELTKAIPKGQKLTPQGMVQFAKNLGRDLDSVVRNSLINPNTMLQYVGAAGTEALEEVSESLMEVGIKESYDRIYQPLFGNTSFAKGMDTDKDVRFGVDYNTLGSELVQAAALGAVGGGIARKFFKGQNEQQNYYKYLASGQFGEVKNRLESLYLKGALGDASTDANGKLVEKGVKSRNDIAYDAITHDLKLAENVWNSRRLNNAYTNNEEKLSQVSSSLAAAQLKDSSIGYDLATALGKIDGLNDEMSKLSADPKADNSKRIIEIQKEIEGHEKDIAQIRDGSRVTKYMQEVLYNIKKPVTAFSKFYQLNEESRNTQVRKENLLKVLEESKKGASLENYKDFSVLDYETGERIKKEAAVKYAPKMEEDGEMTIYPESMDIPFEVDRLVEKGKNIPNPQREVLHNFDFDGKAGSSFEDIITEEKAKIKEFEAKGTGVYNDVEGISALMNNIQARKDQLQMASSINEDVNKAHEKLDDKKQEVTYTPQEVKEYSEKLEENLQDASALLSVAIGNRLNFANAIKTANDAIIRSSISTINDIADLLKSSENVLFTEELSSQIAGDLMTMANAPDSDTVQRAVHEVHKKIYNYFKDSPQTALDFFYNKLGLSSEDVITARIAFNKALGVYTPAVKMVMEGEKPVGEEAVIKNDQTIVSFRTLKMMITLDPEVFASHYKTIVQAVPDEESKEKKYTHARHILSPAQENAVKHIVAFLKDNTKKPHTHLRIQDKSLEYPITEGIFFSSWQGTGKTITSATAAKVRQMMDGGKVVVVATDKTNHQNMIDTLEGLDTKVDNTYLTSVEKLISFLDSNKQGDINTIIYDEATLIRADDLYTLDASIRQINAKRDGSPIKVIFTGDRSQIGASSTTGNFNIASSAFVETTPEMKFSYRTGIDQINNALEHVRKIMSSTHKGTAFATLYDMDKLTGARFEEKEFNSTVSDLMKRLTSNDNYVIITDSKNHGDYRSKYNVPAERILTPEQAQGKQWDYVILDIETGYAIGPQEDIRLTRLLSGLGRAKKFVLSRIDNTTASEGISRNIRSGSGKVINVESNITNDARKIFKKAKLDLLASFNAPIAPINTSTGSQERVKFEKLVDETVVDKVEKLTFTVENRNAIRKIMDTIRSKFPKSVGATEDTVYVMQHSYFSYAETYDEAGNPVEISDIPQILALKRSLLYPNATDEVDVNFSLEVHADERKSRIITTLESDVPAEKKFNPTDKKFVIYANIMEEGKPKYKISMGALNKPEALGLTQSDLFNVEIPFTEKQNKAYLASLRTSVGYDNLSKEEKEASVFTEAPTYKTRNFDMKGESLSVPDFIELNKNMWQFATELLYTTASSTDKKGNEEKQTWLVYSPTKTTEELDRIIRHEQSLIDAPNSDVRKIAVDGGRSLTKEAAFDAIRSFYNQPGGFAKGSRGILPHVSDSAVLNMFRLAKDELGLTLADIEAGLPVIYQQLHKKANSLMKTKRESVMVAAMLKGFFDISGEVSEPFKGKMATKRVTAKYRKGKPKKTEESFQMKEVFQKVKEDKIRFDATKTINHLLQKQDGTDASAAKYATIALNSITNTVFKNGFYYDVKPIENATTPQRGTPFAVADADISLYKVKNLRHPSMPVHHIRLPFIMEVLANEDAYETKITTKVKFKSVEDIEKEKVEKIEPTVRPVNFMRFVMPKNNPGDERSIDSEMFTENTATSRLKSSMFDIFKLYFNQKPYNAKFEKFAEYYSRSIYNGLFKLEGKEPEVVGAEKIDGVLKEMRSQLRKNGKVIDDAIEEVVKSGGSLNRAALLEDEGFERMYFDYIIGKEFDSLLKFKFPYIIKTGTDYSFSSEKYTESAYIDNKEKISHIERGNSLVKMHIFNMPIYNRVIDAKGKEILTFSRFANKQTIAIITKAIRDHKINDIVKAQAFFGTRKDIPEFYSFYKRFLAPEKFGAISGKSGGEVDQHSFFSLKNDISEDTVTGVLSFFASGNETEYVKVDVSEDKLQARFKDIQSNRFADDLELSIKSIGTVEGSTIPVEFLNDGSYNILYGSKRSPKKMNVTSDGRMTFPNNKVSDIGQVLLALNFPSINSEQYKDILYMKMALRPELITGKVLFRIAEYLKSDRKVFMEGNDLTTWLSFATQFQQMAQIDGSFGHTNLGGDKVNLLSLSYPLVRTNQRVDELKKLKEETAHHVNPFVKGNLKVDAYLLKEGYDSYTVSKENSRLTEGEHMDYDFRHLYLKSLVKGSDKSNRNVQSVIFNPMVFSDKTSDAVIRVSGSFLPSSDKNINIEFLKNRAAKAMSDMNSQLGLSIINAYNDAFIKIGKTQTQFRIEANPSPESIKNKLLEINTIVNKLSERDRKALLNTRLVNNLMYKAENGVIVHGVSAGLINSLTEGDIKVEMAKAHQLFVKQYQNRKGAITAEEIQAINNHFNLNTNVDELLDSYFYNHIYTSQSFSTMMAGSIWQYKSGKEYGDQIKRNSQLTTNRQIFVLRRQDYDPTIHSLKHGRKLGATSKTAIITDFKVPIDAINYQGKHQQDVFDGAAFHNIYAMLQMQESQGNTLGFTVSPTLKPISSYMDDAVGHLRFDKYASFLLSPEIVRKGEPFIKKLNELMLTSVSFPEGTIVTDIDGTALYTGEETTVVDDGITKATATAQISPKNVFELEKIVALKRGLDFNTQYFEIAKETLDVLVKNNLQDSYLQEAIFDTSVKTGVSNLNSVENFDAFNNVRSLNYMERGNNERGLVLDSSHEPNENDGAFPTQVVSAVLQGNYSTQEAKDLLKAIHLLGEKGRDEMSGADFMDISREQLRNRINDRGDIGLIHGIVNKPNFSINNKTIFGQLFSAVASKLSRDTISFRIKGGQQVVGPAYNVMNHPETGEPLKGFDARNEAGESIKDHDAWKNLVQLVDNKASKKEIDTARELVHTLLSTIYKTVQKPEVIMAPTMFKDFNIPAGTQLRDIEAGFAQGLYKGTYEDFKKTLDVIIARIPGTNKQSYMGATIVGFAHDSANTFYTNIDLLYLQGADQDIDKGNILTYEMEDGKITIPTEVTLANSVVEIKNYIVSKVIASSGKSETLMESTMPTATKTLKKLADKYIKEQDEFIHYLNPFSIATMFVRGQGGKTNISIHANGLKTYSSIYHSLRQRNGNGLAQYTPLSDELGQQPAEVKGIAGGNDFFATMAFFSELINASVDNAKDPILGALGINATTGNLVNTMAILGYSPEQVVEFLHNADVVQAVRNLEKHNEFSTDFKATKTLADAANELLKSNPNSKALKDLVVFSDMADDYFMLSQVLGINTEVPNSPYEYYRYTTAVNLYLDGITTIEEFVNLPESFQEQKIQILQNRIADPAYGKYINVLQILKDNENMMSYVKSAALVNKEMMTNSHIYNMVSKIAARASVMTGKPINENSYKDIQNFVYGLVVDEYLSQNPNGTQVTMTINGVPRTYNLALTANDGHHFLGRAEFMNDFPGYFENDLVPTRQNTLRNYMVVEILGQEGKTYKKKNIELGTISTIAEPDQRVPVLKMIGDFRSQTPEKKISIMSAMQMLEKGDLVTADESGKGDTSVKEMLFLYSLIKDKGGNSSTSFTALFDPEDFIDFDTFLDGFDQKSAYDMNSERDIRDLLAIVKGLSTNMSDAIKGGVKIDPKRRFAIPYKNDRTKNDESKLIESNKFKNEVRADKPTDIANAVKANADVIVTSNTNHNLRDYGYVFDKERSKKGTYFWNNVKEPVVKKQTKSDNRRTVDNPFTGFSDWTIQGDDSTTDKADLPNQGESNEPIDNAPFSRTDFEEEQKRRNFARVTDYKTLKTVASIITKNTGINIEVLTSKQIAQVYGNHYSALRGFVAPDGTPIVNADRNGLDVPMHEMGHLWIQALKGSNPELYQRIITESSSHEMMNRVAQQYPELSGEALAEEVFSTLFGLSQQDKALSSYNSDFLTKMRDTFIAFLEWLDNYMGNIFGTKVYTDDSLLSIMNKVGDRMLSSSVFNFNSSDIYILNTLGVASSPLSSELRAIQSDLKRQGLMETIC